MSLRERYTDLKERHLHSGGLEKEDYQMMDLWLLGSDARPGDAELENCSPAQEVRGDLAILSKSKLDLWAGTHPARKKALAAAERNPKPFPISPLAEDLWKIAIDFRDLPPILDKERPFDQEPGDDASLRYLILIQPPLWIFPKLKKPALQTLHVVWYDSPEIRNAEWLKLEAPSMAGKAVVEGLPDRSLPEGFIEWAYSGGCWDLDILDTLNSLPDNIDPGDRCHSMLVGVRISWPTAIPARWIKMAMSGEPKPQKSIRGEKLLVYVLSNLKPPPYLSQREASVTVLIKNFQLNAEQIENRLRYLPALQTGCLRIYTASKARPAGLDLHKQERKFTPRDSLKKLRW